MIRGAVMASVLERTLFEEVNFEDPLFDSLKEQYGEFTDWFRRKQEASEPVYVIRQAGSVKLRGFIYLKEEAGAVLGGVDEFAIEDRLGIERSRYRGGVGELA